MILRANVRFYFWVYFLLVFLLYYFYVRHYFYWGYIAGIKKSTFDFIPLRVFIGVIIFSINLKYLLRVNKSSLTFTVTSIFLVLSIIPSIITFMSSELYLWKIFAMQQLLFFSLCLTSKINISFDRFPVVNSNQSIHLLLIVIFVAAIPFLIAFGPYINLNNLILKEIYETRELMNQNANLYTAYFYSPISKILIPLFVVLSFEKKNLIYAFLGCLFLVLFFLFGAHKVILFGVFSLLVFYRFSYFNIVIFFLKLVIFLIMTSLVLATLGFDELWIMLFRRLFFMPALLDICYFDYFQDISLFWSNSVLSGFISYPLDMSPARTIGDEYFRHKGMYANNGIISDGFMNFGIIGVVLNIMIFSIYIMIFNNMNISSKYFGLFFLLIISTISSPLFPVFLTHGGIVLLVISFFLLKRKNHNKFF